MCWVVKAKVAKWKPRTLLENGTIGINIFCTTTKFPTGVKLQDKAFPPSSALGVLSDFALRGNAVLPAPPLPGLPWPTDPFIDASMSFASLVPFETSSFQRMYRLIRLLGGGRYGKVYLAVDNGLGTEVAIKICRADEGNEIGRAHV